MCAARKGSILTVPSSLRIFYTAALHGALHVLPRLATFLAAEKAAANMPALLVDLGRSCAPGAWICEATGGRGMLVAMDALGYDAFHIGPQDVLYHYPELVNQIRQIVVTPFAAGPWTTRVTRGETVIQVVNGRHLPRYAAEPPADCDLILGLGLENTAHVEAAYHAPGRFLSLTGGADGLGGQPRIGRVDITISPDAPYIRILDSRALALSSDVQPNPGVSAVIEFVQSEARQAERKRGQS